MKFVSGANSFVECVYELLSIFVVLLHQLLPHSHSLLFPKQYVDFFIERGPITLSKDVCHTILEYHGEPILAHTRSKFDSSSGLVVPVMPPTMKGACRLLHIYYMLKVWIEMESSGEVLHMNFPLTIATSPFRIPNSPHQPIVSYGQYMITTFSCFRSCYTLFPHLSVSRTHSLFAFILSFPRLSLSPSPSLSRSTEPCCGHAEGGVYIGPEFQLGQVYDGTLGIEEVSGETVVLYRPVYVCVPPPVHRMSIAADKEKKDKVHHTSSDKKQEVVT